MNGPMRMWSAEDSIEMTIIIIIVVVVEHGR